jgi:hypothetical protein
MAWTILFIVSGCSQKYVHDEAHPLVLRRAAFYVGSQEGNLCDVTAADAERYRDTCTAGLPVGAIVFCRPFTSFFSRGSEYPFQLQEHAIIGYWYNWLTLADEHPIVAGITYYDGSGPHERNVSKEGDPKLGNGDTADNRMVRELMKRLDEKYHTNNVEMSYLMANPGITVHKVKKPHGAAKVPAGTKGN